ncbi:N-acetylmuramoyl-L-alanine amidase [Lachnospiraceae bacterium TWA4]|nr:N-acetylmuramoyl-L-alanine amidase [Lachnospiraceae bacterium TWA4]
MEGYEEKTIASISSKNLLDTKTVVLDAGHGGNDAGKIGVHNELEKDINLTIVKIIKKELEAKNIHVILTRDTDKALYSEGASNKKIEDLSKRCKIIEEAKPILAVSIHQNSYHEDNVCGPQVFYYKSSKQGKLAAQILQESFNDVVGKEKNSRKIKSNDNYYLLLHTKAPVVICECGFLSNNEEATKLSTSEYQQKIGINLAKGILNYIKENKCLKNIDNRFYL